MIIKEIDRIDLGIPCKWNIEECLYFENGIDDYKKKLECSPEYGVRCNGKKYKVIYEIDNELYSVIESQEFSKPLEKPIETNIDKNYLINQLNKGHTMNYILKYEL